MIEAAVYVLLATVCVLVVLLLTYLYYVWKNRKRLSNLEHHVYTNGGFSFQRDKDKEVGLPTEQSEIPITPSSSTYEALGMDVTSPQENARLSTVSNDKPPSEFLELTPHDYVNAAASDLPEMASTSHAPVNNVYSNVELSSMSNESTTNLSNDPRCSAESTFGEDTDDSENNHVYEVDGPFAERGPKLTSSESDVDHMKLRTLPPFPVQDNSLGTKTLMVTAVRLNHPDASIVSMRIFLLSPVSAESLSDILEVRNVNGGVLTKEPVAMRPSGKSLKVTIDCIHGGLLLNPDYSAQVIDFNLVWADENPSVTFHFKANNEAIDTGILVCKLTVLQDDQPLRCIDLSTSIAGKTNCQAELNATREESRYTNLTPQDDALCLTLNDPLYQQLNVRTAIDTNN